MEEKKVSCSPIEFQISIRLFGRVEIEFAFTHTFYDVPMKFTPFPDSGDEQRKNNKTLCNFYGMKKEITLLN